MNSFIFSWYLKFSSLHESNIKFFTIMKFPVDNKLISAVTVFLYSIYLI